MKSFCFICLVSLLAMPLCSFSQTQEIKEGILRIKFKKTLQVKDLGQRTAYTDGFAQTGIQALDVLNKKYGVTNIKRVIPVGGRYEFAHQQYGLHLWFDITFDSLTEYTMADLLQDFDALEEVSVAEPAYQMSLFAEENDGNPSKSIIQEKSKHISTIPSAAPNDPLFKDQWHYNNTGQTGGKVGADIDLINAWSIERGSKEVIVAIIDGGIDVDHKDLSAAMWVNEAELNGIPGADDDNNGYMDDVHGYGFGDRTGKISPHYHGTHVAGTVGAVNDNGVGVSGVAGGSGTGDGVRLLSCAVFGLRSQGGFEESFIYAADNGAVIAQNSWGGGAPSTLMEESIEYFIARAGFDNSEENFHQNIQTGPMAGGIVIFAAGNGNTRVPSYPGGLGQVVAVASTGNSDQKASYSHYGDWIELSAPGGDHSPGVLSTFPGNVYNNISGTSMACPQVSGVAALIVSQFGGGGYLPGLVWNRLVETTDFIDDQNPGYEGMLGSGRLNAFNALQTNDGVPPGTIHDLRTSATNFSSIKLSWTATGNSGEEGAASVYDLRYALSPITEDNFKEATIVTKLPRPLPSGEIEVFEVTGLLPSTPYYFALKAFDIFGIASEISNTIHATTTSPPVMVVTPASLHENLNSGQTSTQTFSIKNTGSGTLDFKINIRPSPPVTSSLADNSSGYSFATSQEVSIRHRVEDPYSDLTNGFQRTQQSAKPIQFSDRQGLSAVGRLFNINYENNRIEEVDPSDGKVISSFAPPEQFSGGPDGIAFDGTYLYFINGFGSNKVYQINPGSGEVTGQAVLENLPSIDALAHSGEYLYAQDYSNNRVYEIDFSQQSAVRTINFNTSTGGGISFGGSRGTLFVSNFSGGIFEMDLLTGEIINRLPSPMHVLGLGYSESLNILFASDFSGTAYALNPDDGSVLYSFSLAKSSGIASDEALGNAWLTTDTYSGSIGEGETFEINALFDASHLKGRAYAKYFIISSNDPETPVKSLPVTLNVVGAPNVNTLRNSLNFGTVFLNEESRDSLIITNTGTEILAVGGITSDKTEFRVENVAFSLNPRESRVVHASFSSPGTGIVAGKMTIISNDPNEPAYVVHLQGKSVEPPVIEVDLPSLSDSLYTGEMSVKFLTIQNSGKSDLLWEMLNIGHSPNVIAASRDKSQDIVRTNLLPSEHFEAKFGADQQGILMGIPYREGFESGNFDSWKEEVKGGIKEVTSTTSASGEFSFYYNNNTVGHAHGIHQEFTNSKPAYISFYIKSGSTTTTDAYFVLSSGMQEAIFFFARANGTLYVNEDVGGDNSVYYEALQWYHIEFRDMDWEDKDFDYYVNGELIKADIPFRNPHSEGINRLNLYNYSHNAKAWWDDIHIGDQQNNWLYSDTLTGTVPKGSSQKAGITFDAREVPAREYNTEILITSNDPLSPQVKVPISLLVSNAPNINVSKTFVDMGHLFVGAEVRKDFKIYNTGTETLIITDIHISSDEYAVNLWDGEIASGDSLDFSIKFSPTTPGDKPAKLIMESNDPNQSQTTIVLSGVGAQPPIAHIDTTALFHYLYIDEKMDIDLYIGNEAGGSGLDYSLGQIPWITSVDSSGTISPGESKEINLTLDAGGLKLGSYEALLNINTNDPTLTSTAIPVRMEVVSNKPPYLSKVMAGQETMLGGGETTIKLMHYFSDPDNDQLTFTATSTDNDIILPAISTSNLLLDQQKAGIANINIVAYDGNGFQAHTSFVVRVLEPLGIEDAAEDKNELHVYPNPFAHEITVKYNLETASPVLLEMWNTLGERVELLVNGHQPAGNHKEVFKASDLPPGIYFIRLQSDNKKVDSRRIIRK